MCSVGWRFDAGVAALEGLSLAIGVVLAQVLERHELKPGLKWPNDVLVGDGKLAGILAEVSAPVVVMGLGLNVSFDETERPDPNAVSLSMLGHHADRNELVISLLQGLSSRLAHWRAAAGADADLAADYRNASTTRARRRWSACLSGSGAGSIPCSGRLSISGSGPSLERSGRRSQW